jgi:tetratricopeptide (TPR) repeat protein
VDKHWRCGEARNRKRAELLRLRAQGHLMKADHGAAITLYRQATDLIREIAPVDLAVHLIDLARAESYAGDSAAAERDYAEALRLAQAAGNEGRVAIIKGNLAAIAIDRQDWQAVETLAREALALSVKIGRQDLIASNNQRIATARLRSGKPEEALPFIQQAVTLWTRLRSPELARAHALLTECESAVRTNVPDGESA